MNTQQRIDYTNKQMREMDDCCGHTVGRESVETVEQRSGGAVANTWNGPAVILLAFLFLSGCAAHKPKAAVPQTHEQWEPVPGHPWLHYGPEHLECDISNNCEMVRDWLDKDGKPMLTPLGCWISKYLFVTRALGDKPSQCESADKKAMERVGKP